METGTGTIIERERRRGGEFSYRPHQERSRVKNQALPFPTRHHLCRQEIAPAGSQQFRAQYPAPVRRCGTDGKTGHPGREEENGDGNWDGGGDGNEDEYGSGREGRDGDENGNGDGDENREESGREIGSKNQQKW